MRRMAGRVFIDNRRADGEAVLDRLLHRGRAQRLEQFQNGGGGKDFGVALEDLANIAVAGDDPAVNLRAVENRFFNTRTSVKGVGFGVEGVEGLPEMRYGTYGGGRNGLFVNHIPMIPLKPGQIHRRAGREWIVLRRYFDPSETSAKIAVGRPSMLCVFLLRWYSSRSASLRFSQYLRNVSRSVR
jgi:hypothetical protein